MKRPQYTFSSKSGGPVRNRLVISFPRTCIYRWAPGKWTKIQTEPAPSDLIKATGIGPRLREGQNPPPIDIGRRGALGKGLGRSWRKPSCFQSLACAADGRPSLCQTLPAGQKPRRLPGSRYEPAPAGCHRLLRSASTRLWSSTRSSDRL